MIKYNAQAQSILGDGLELAQRTIKCANPVDSLALTNLVAEVRRKTVQDAISPLPFVLAHDRRNGR